MNAIRLENITKSYGSNLVLNNFSMSINSGEFVAIKGASGSGKSTILNILGLMENFDSGKYYLFDKMMSNCDSVQNIKILRNDVSYLFQNFALINDKTVLDNLKIAIRFLNISKKEKESRVFEALDSVGLVGYDKKKIYQLSGGEQQRVALARILLKPSKIILADEPTGSLDIKNRDNVMNILSALNQEGKTIVVVTHDPSIVECAQRIISLEKQ